MIKKFIDKLLGKTPGGARGSKKPSFGKREEVSADVHGINPELVDRRASDVVRTLKQAGFEAYIVGGAVRDLLVGLRPKDFDVATNARQNRSKACSAVPSSSGGASVSCTWCTAGGVSTR